MTPAAPARGPGTARALERTVGRKARPDKDPIGITPECSESVWEGQNLAPPRPGPAAPPRRKEMYRTPFTLAMFYPGPCKPPPPVTSCRRPSAKPSMRLPANPSEPRVRLRVGGELLQRDDGCIDAILQPAQLLYV